MPRSVAGTSILAARGVHLFTSQYPASGCGLNTTTVLQPCSIPSSGTKPGTDGKVSRPDRVVGSERRNSASGNNSALIIGAKPIGEFFAAAARLGQQEPAFVDVLPEHLFLHGRQFWSLVAVHIDDRRLQQVGDFVPQCVPALKCQLAGVVDLPGERLAFEEFLAGELGEVTGVVVLVVPILAGAVSKFANEDRRAALGKEQQGEARGDSGVGVGPSRAETRTRLRAASRRGIRQPSRYQSCPARNR